MAAEERDVEARANWCEYLEYFAQAGGQINLEQDAEDAVQLMTVHAAKGLEFEHVFVLRLTHRGFPMAPRTSMLEFPAELMKEELPKGDFHMQEERRLFYVALTRARERLTLTTVLHKRSKPSVFLDDILSSPQLARQHVATAGAGSRCRPRARQTPARRTSSLFPEAAGERGSIRASANGRESYRPPVFEPLRLSASAIDSYRNCPQKYLFGAASGALPRARAQRPPSAT